MVLHVLGGVPGDHDDLGLPVLGRPPPESFGNHLRGHRKSFGLTQERLALPFAMDVRYVRKTELGRQYLQLLTIV